MICKKNKLLLLGIADNVFHFYFVLSNDSIILISTIKRPRPLQKWSSHKIVTRIGCFYQAVVRTGFERMCRKRMAR